MCQGHLKLPMEFYQEFSRMVQESARKCMSATRLHSSPQEKHAREPAAGAGSGESLALGVALAPFLVFRCPARSPVCPPTEGSSLWWKTRPSVFVSACSRDLGERRHQVSSWKNSILA